MKIFYITFLLLLGIKQVSAQQTFTKRDSLQGGLRPERTCFDVLRYDLNIKINPNEKSVEGYNKITFKVIENATKIQLDLFENMKIDSIVFNSKKLSYKREFGSVFINFEKLLIKNSEEKLLFYYSGKPLEAKNAPWNGGFVWTHDSNEKDWIGVAVQGTGASLWYPVKDSQTDEPDNGTTIKIAVPNGLMNVSNGRFLGSENLKNGYTRWDWEVKNPINNYNITINIGDYVHFGKNYNGLDLDYYVLRENEAKARKQFEQVKPMLDCFQSKFGEFPFKNDGYKLVETPYLGMEHQSCIAYGNKYQQAYLGTDLSGTGIGMKFDYVIIHESAHEWFGNSITSKDIADMWIHEAFTCYSETVFVECQYGYKNALKYVNGQSKNILNDIPIIGKYGVNHEGSTDMYYKGSLMLNTLRHVINDDKKWWEILKSFSTTFRHQLIDTETVITFFNKESGINLTPVFNQYLRYTNIPVLELRKKNDKLEYRWKTDETDFIMPIDITIKGKKIRLKPTNSYQISDFNLKSLYDINIPYDKFHIKTVKF
ncbi:MAG: M1 family metallopeptidase [Flavobacterium sp.]